MILPETVNLMYLKNSPHNHFIVSIIYVKLGRKWEDDQKTKTCILYINTNLHYMLPTIFIFFLTLTMFNSLE